MCLSHNTVGSLCAAVWNGGAVTVAYVFGWQVRNTVDSAKTKLRISLPKVVGGLADWDPALSIFGS